MRALTHNDDIDRIVDRWEQRRFADNEGDRYDFINHSPSLDALIEAARHTGSDCDDGGCSPDCRHYDGDEQPNDDSTHDGCRWPAALVQSDVLIGGQYRDVFHCETCGVTYDKPSI